MAHAGASNESLIDSLKKAVKNTEDSNTVKTLLSLSKAYQRDSFPASEYFANAAIDMAKKINYLNGVSEGYRKIAVANYYQNNYDKAIVYYQKAIETDEKTGYTPGLAACYNNLGLIFETKADYSQALHYFYKALELNEKDDNQHGISSSLSNIGLVYDGMGKYDEALDVHSRAYKIAKAGNDLENLAGACVNIGLVHEVKGNHQKAIEFQLEALKLYEKLKIDQLIATCYTNIAINYELLNENNKAFEFYRRALSINTKINNKEGLISSYFNLGEFYKKLKEYKKSIKVLDSALSLARELEINYKIMKIRLLLAEVFYLMGDGNNAYLIHQQYSAIKDSIYNEESSGQIAEIEGKYQNEKKQLEIEKLEKDTQVQHAELQKQNTQKIALGSGLALVLILALVIFRGYRQKEKSALLLARQKQQIEIKNSHLEKANTEIHQKKSEIEEKNNEIISSIRYAQRIQEAILPPQKLVKSYLENSFILYKPKDIVAGDFYWMAPLPSAKPLVSGEGILPQAIQNPSTSGLSNNPSGECDAGGPLLFAVCDCTGHGVPGAFVSIVAHNALNRAVKEFSLTKPSEILDKVNELVQETFSKSESDIKDGMDIALCALKKIDDNWELEYAGANNAIYVIRNEELTEIKADVQPIGKYAKRIPFRNHIVELQKGDSVYAFTDGYADQFGGPKGKKFKYSQFEKLLVSIQSNSMTEQREILNNTIDTWKGELDQVDDICIIGVKL